MTKDTHFALEEARLVRYLKGATVSPPPLKAKKDSEDLMEKILAQEEKICEFQDNSRKTVAKIGKMYAD